MSIRNSNLSLHAEFTMSIMVLVVQITTVIGKYFVFNGDNITSDRCDIILTPFIFLKLCVTNSHIHLDLRQILAKVQLDHRIMNISLLYLPCTHPLCSALQAYMVYIGKKPHIELKTFLLFLSRVTREETWIQTPLLSTTLEINNYTVVMGKAY
jgi:hypothetical protein